MQRFEIDAVTEHPEVQETAQRLQSAGIGQKVINDIIYKALSGITNPGLATAVIIVVGAMENYLATQENKRGFWRWIKRLFS